ncbi:acyltransferase [Granulosicoccaceae sp. 1_MG-2023]|nr:acyltransferase [Granulosicoccaceae sp. 1_MG-2023]
MYLHSFSHFRALAIVLVVAGHSYGLAGWKVDSLPEQVLASLITGATGLFVFISGFFFHFVFYKRFEYRAFMRKKFNAVLLPYLALSTLGIVFYVYLLGQPPYEDQFYTDKPGLWNEHLRPIWLYYWYGAAAFPYWYIPFIMLTFLMAPLHKRFIESSLPYQVAIVAGLALLAMLIHRPLYNLSNLQAALYFTPFYLLGICASLYAEPLRRYFYGREWTLLAAAVFFALLEAVLFQRYGNTHKLPWMPAAPDLMVPQKIALCLFFFVWLRRFDDVPNAALNQVAGMSFAIFFLHPWVLDFTGMALRSQQIYFSQGWLLPLAVLWVTALSMALALLCKRLLGQHSLRFIGW